MSWAGPFFRTGGATARLNQLTRRGGTINAGKVGMGSKSMLRAIPA